MEWGLEWFYYRLRSLALFDLLELAGRVTVLVIAVFWVLEADERQKAKHYRAWELINAARGSTADGGRIDALKDLNDDGVSLARAPLEKAYLNDIDLKEAYLVDANLEGAYLRRANLERATLRGASLDNAELSFAKLAFADLEGAYLIGTKLYGADLRGANFAGAFIFRSGWIPLRRDRNSTTASSGTDFSSANLDGAIITQEQVDNAIGNKQTRLPRGLSRPAQWWEAEVNEEQPGAEPEE